MTVSKQIIHPEQASPRHTLHPESSLCLPVLPHTRVSLILSSSLGFIIPGNPSRSRAPSRAPSYPQRWPNFTASACVCSIGTFFVASRVSPFKKNCNQTSFSSSPAHLLSSRLYRGLTVLFVLLIRVDVPSSIILCFTSFSPVLAAL